MLIDAPNRIFRTLFFVYDKRGSVAANETATSLSNAGSRATFPFSSALPQKPIGGRFANAGENRGSCLGQAMLWSDK